MDRVVIVEFLSSHAQSLVLGFCIFSLWSSSSIFTSGFIVSTPPDGSEVGEPVEVLAQGGT